MYKAKAAICQSAQEVKSLKTPRALMAYSRRGGTTYRLNAHRNTTEGLINKQRQDGMLAKTYNISSDARIRRVVQKSLHTLSQSPNQNVFGVRVCSRLVFMLHKIPQSLTYIPPLLLFPCLIF